MFEFTDNPICSKCLKPGPKWDYHDEHTSAWTTTGCFQCNRGNHDHILLVCQKCGHRWVMKPADRTAE